MLYPIFIIPIEWKLLEKHILSILIVSLFAIIIFIIPYLFGGNVTWIGSSAGVVAVGISLKYGHKISFIRWFKIGFPFMILTVGLGSVILMLMTLISL